MISDSFQKIAPPVIQAASLPHLELRDSALRFDRAPAIDLPALAADGAVCLGLSIDWRRSEALREFALRHTHPEEHARAARFLRPEDSLRHLLGRTLLRTLAIHYTGMAPDQALPLNAWGKPEPAPQRASCNLSHSGNQVWAALSYLPHLGIDVESATAPTDFRGIMRSFHPDEIAELEASPDTPRAMMRCWARKEAIAKAAGMGLSLPLHDYAVSCASASADWLRVAPQALQQATWSTIDLPLETEYMGALAIAGACRHVTVLSLICDI